MLCRLSTGIVYRWLTPAPTAEHLRRAGFALRIKSIPNLVSARPAKMDRSVDPAKIVPIGVKYSIGSLTIVPRALPSRIKRAKGALFLGGWRSADD